MFQHNYYISKVVIYGRKGVNSFDGLTLKVLGHEGNLALTEISTQYAVFNNVDRIGQEIKIELYINKIQLAEVLVYGAKQPGKGG